MGVEEEQKNDSTKPEPKSLGLELIDFVYDHTKRVKYSKTDVCVALSGSCGAILGSQLFDTPPLAQDQVEELFIQNFIKNYRDMIKEARWKHKNK